LLYRLLRSSRSTARVDVAVLVLTSGAVTTASSVGSSLTISTKAVTSSAIKPAYPNARTIAFLCFADG
jgi:hypothetical protein